MTDGNASPLQGLGVPSPQAAFEAFTSFVAQFDPIDLLSQLTLTFLFTPETFTGEGSAVRLRARWIEFTAGCLAVRPINEERHGAFHGASIDTFETLIKQYFDSLPIHLMTHQPSPVERTAADRLLMSAKIESLYVRGDAYPHQFFEYASELYGLHDQWFNSNLGFTIDEAIRIARSAPAELERRVNQSGAKARADAPRRAEEFLQADEAKGLTRRELELGIACQMHFGGARQLLGFTVGEVARISGVI
jgi:hypothetical protein